MAYGRLIPDDIPFVNLDGSWEGERKPSPPNGVSTGISTPPARRPAPCSTPTPLRHQPGLPAPGHPPFHHDRRFGGDTVRCAAYATFGSQVLSDAALARDGRPHRLPAGQPRPAAPRLRTSTRPPGPGHRVGRTLRPVLAGLSVKVNRCFRGGNGGGAEKVPELRATGLRG